MKNSKFSKKISALRDQTWLRPVLLVFILFALMLTALYIYNREMQSDHERVLSLINHPTSEKVNFVELWESEMVSGSRTNLLLGSPSLHLQ